MAGIKSMVDYEATSGAWSLAGGEWLVVNAIRHLNVAGASEGKRPGIHGATIRLLELIFLGE